MNALFAHGRFAGARTASSLTRRIAAALVLSAGLVFSVNALAFSSACAEDIKSHCSEVKPGAYRLTGCLQMNKAKLQPACRAEVYATVERGAEFARNCEQHFKMLCPKIAPGQGRLYSCLGMQEQQLSPQCKAHLFPEPQP